MNRFFAFAVAGALVAGASGADAQDRISSRLDLGVYGGYSWTSPWFAYDDADFSIGANPVLGSTVTLWGTPAIGLRANGSYIPSTGPTADGIPAEIANLDYPYNNWLVDLSAVFRPFRPSDSELLPSLYFWLGGGIVRSDFRGASRTGCVPEYDPYEVCVKTDPNKATNGQGTVGVGFDYIRRESLFGFFGEIGTHMYNSPTHLVAGSTAEDKFAVTVRGVAGVKLALGSIFAPIVPIPPAPPPPPPPPPPPAERTIQVCVVQNGAVQNISATFSPATNDTTVNGVAFAQAHPVTAPNYAAGANWFIQSSDMAYADRDWVKYGVSRVIQPSQVQRVGEFQGTSIFAESGATAPYEVVYIPVRPGCEFQPYTPREIIRPRG